MEKVFDLTTLFVIGIGVTSLSLVLVDRVLFPKTESKKRAKIEVRP